MKQLATTNLSNLVRRIKDWWSYNVFWDKNLFCFVGMVFSRSLAKNAVVDILVVYLSATEDVLILSAILSNIQGGLSSVLEIVMSHLADCIIGRFRIISFSTYAYMGGLLILWLFNPSDVKWLITVAIVLLSIGTSGDVVLEDKLKDVVRQQDKSPDSTEKRVVARSKTWFRISNTFAAGVAVLLVYAMISSRDSPLWNPVFLGCTIAMGITLLLFLVGNWFHPDNRLPDRPFNIFFRVCRAAYLKRHSSYSTDPHSYFHDESSPPPSTMPNLSYCRLLANAAKITEGQEDKRTERDCTLEEVEVVDHVFKMLPMWATFLVVSLVSATGSTFFIEQYDYLKRPKFLPIVIFTIIQDFSAFIILLVYPKILSICKCRFRKNKKVQIGVGMLCSILCCVLAWRLEVERLIDVNNYSNYSISFGWLIPQFCVLGFMEGLAENGLLEFFKSQLGKRHKSITVYVSQYIEFVLGIGKLFSIILILIFRRHGWFGDTLDDSRLDNYYLTLACICLVNLGLYCGIAKFVYKDAGSEQEPSNDDSHTGDRVSI